MYLIAQISLSDTTEFSFVADEIIKLTTDSDRSVMKIRKYQYDFLQKAVKGIFNIGLAHTLPSHKFHALKQCFQVLKQQQRYISQMNWKRSFISSQTLFQAATFFLRQYNNLQVLTILQTVADIRGWFFQSISRDIVNYFRNLISNTSSDVIRFKAIDISIIIIYNEAQVSQKKQAWKQIIRLMAVRIDVYKRENNLTKGHFLNDFGVKIICDYAKNYSKEKVHPTIRTIFKECLEDEEWMIQGIGMSILLNLTDHFKSNIDLKDDVGLIVEFLKGDNPDLRWIACEAAKYILGERSQDIAKYYVTEWLTQILDLLSREKFIKVQLVAFQTFQLAARNANHRNLVGHLEGLVDMMLRFIVPSDNQQEIQQKAFKALLVTSRRCKLVQYYPSLIDAFSECFCHPDFKKSDISTRNGLLILFQAIPKQDQRIANFNHLYQLIQLVRYVQNFFAGTQNSHKVLSQFYYMVLPLCRQISFHIHYIRADFRPFFFDSLDIFQREFQQEVSRFLKDKKSKVIRYCQSFWQFFENSLKIFAKQLGNHSIIIIRFLGNIFRLSINRGKNQIAAQKFLDKFIQKFKHSYQHLIKQFRIIFRYALRELGKDQNQKSFRYFFTTLNTISKIPGVLQQEELVHFFQSCQRISGSLKYNQFEIFMIEMIGSSLINNIFTYQNVSQKFAREILQDMVCKSFELTKIKFKSLFGISVTINIFLSFGSSICLKQLQAIDELMPQFMKSRYYTSRMAVWKWIEALSLKNQLSQPAIIENLDKLLKQQRKYSQPSIIEKNTIYSRQILMCISKIVKAYCPSINLHQQFSELLIRMIRISFYGKNLIILMHILIADPQIIKGNQSANILRNLYTLYSKILNQRQNHDPSLIQKIYEHISLLRYDASLDEDLTRNYRIEQRGQRRG